jgi:hypothetical protein
MITRQLLPIFVLSIEVLAPLGCGSQSQAPSDVTQRPNQTLSKIDPVGDASKVAAVPGLPLVGDQASYSAQRPCHGIRAFFCTPPRICLRGTDGA